MVSETEFATCRSIQAFSDWVDEWVTHRSSGLGNYFSFLRRVDDWDKKMAAEAIPVQKYLRLFHAKSDAFVELNSERGHRSDGFDAKISAPDGTVLEYVQVIGVPAKDEHTDRLIFAEGYTFQASDDRPEPVTKKAYDYEEHRRQFLTFNNLAECKATVLESIRKKTRNAYQKPATLVVVLDADMIVEDEDRFNEVVVSIHEHLEAPGSFSRIVVMAFGTDLIKSLEFGKT